MPQFSEKVELSIVLRLEAVDEEAGQRLVEIWKERLKKLIQHSSWLSNVLVTAVVMKPSHRSEA